MKRIIYFLIVLILSFISLIGLVFSACTPCCCQTAPGSGQYRCYNSGWCCKIGTDEEYWDPSNECYRFEVWLEPERAAFVVGTKTSINLYIKNTGDYTDNYVIDYDLTPSHLAFVDLITEVKNVAPDEIREINPKITVLTSMEQGTVDFTITSVKAGEKHAILRILESGLPMSLPEFSSFALIGIMILSGLIYYVYVKRCVI